MWWKLVNKQGIKNCKNGLKSYLTIFSAIGGLCTTYHAGTQPILAKPDHSSLARGKKNPWILERGTRNQSLYKAL